MLYPNGGCSCSRSVWVLRLGWIRPEIQPEDQAITWTNQLGNSTKFCRFRSRLFCPRLRDSTLQCEPAALFSRLILLFNAYLRATSRVDRINAVCWLQLVPLNAQPDGGCRCGAAGRFARFLQSGDHLLDIFQTCKPIATSSHNLNVFILIRAAAGAVGCRFHDGALERSHRLILWEPQKTPIL